ncbi:Mo-dependent nitrogenase family protein [Thalassoporum mexicanum PCC 7367]|uniref:Mo-dependent nitrogenase C-terminal domain-containing protein n=1 Tax=Thalassoporum mexicanum TaxID=3457544 RepID=UPI00029FC49C|nr:Mo-dependent nitrogenase C-terminal domain-containing protein [Pseudanabaena sp. PCC 7367]AFY70743.1 Mo-dependent nitrogenase family protein [Pseudanabaena sp. PCC 7367]
MTATEIPYSNTQITAWLRGLMSIAWADNDFSPSEKELLQEFTQDRHLEAFTDASSLDQLKPITPQELKEAFGDDADMAENFLRTAVMMAMVDGEYSISEDDLIQEYCEALGQEIQAIAQLRKAIQASPDEEQHPNLLEPVKEWMDHLDIKDQRLAKFICKVVPAQCPFERDVYLFGKKIMHIPAMCKINPLFDQLMGLRFKSLSYLADECGQDVSKYC